MAEGDTIMRLARRFDEALVGSEVSVRTPGRRRPDGRPANQLEGRTLTGAESRGKHLLLRFDEELVLHSHLGMKGAWHLYRPGERWRKPAVAAWVALAGERAEAVNFGGTSMRIVREGELRPRPAPRAPRARHPRRRPDPAGRGRIASPRGGRHPARRRDARPDPPRRDRQHLQERGLLAGARRSLAPARRSERGRARIRRWRGSRTDARRGRDRAPAEARLSPRPHALPALQDADPLPRPGRLGEGHLLVPALSGIIARWAPEEGLTHV